MIDYADIEAARIRRETIERWIRILSKGGDPETIGKRVLTIEFILNAAEDVRQTDLAQELDYSKQRASAAIDYWRKIIEAETFRREADPPL